MDFKIKCCKCGSEDGDIFSCEKIYIETKEKEIDAVRITYICNSCGHMEDRTCYLYMI